MDLLAYTPVEFNYLETLAEVFIIPARKKQFIRETVFRKASVRRNAIAMNLNSASPDHTLEIHSGPKNST